MAAPDPDRLAARAAEALRGGDVRVGHLRRLSGGASRETWSFDAIVDGARHPLVLRRDPGAGAQSATSRATEYELLRAAHAGGVAVPAVVAILQPSDGLGTGFVMVRVDGETIPRRILREEHLAPGRLTAQIATEAARIHALDPATLPPLPIQGPDEHLDLLRRLLDAFGEPHPAFELALRRLGRDVPRARAARLVHGDLRNGNLVVGEEGLRAVLDWELAHLGDPVEDLGWMCVRAWRFGVDDRRVGGLGNVDEMLAAYAGAGGEPVDPEALRWWELLGTVRWGVICQVQARTHLDGARRSVELAALGRRSCENEWDALELLG